MVEGSGIEEDLSPLLEALDNATTFDVTEDEEERIEELWFYVSNYPAVRELLEKAYVVFGLEERSAEPGRVRDREDDADVTVRGTADAIESFTKWLQHSYLEGIYGELQIEGEDVE